MTSEKSSSERKRGTRVYSSANSATEAGTWALVAVTPENYYAACKACLAAKGSAFLIALANGKHEGVEYSYTAKQWGAWLAFFKRTGIKTAFMLMRDWYQVPTEWPHEFTSDSTVQQDYEAGSEFERRFLQAKHEGEAKEDEFRRPRKPPPAKETYRPYPMVWEAFAGDLDAMKRLNSGLTFEALTEVSRDFAMHGKAVARETLLKLFPPPLSRTVQDALARGPKKIPHDPRRPKTPLDHLLPPLPDKAMPRDLGEFPEHLLETDLLRRGA